MNNIYIDKLPISCNECMCLNQDIEDGCHCNLGVFGCEEFYKFYGRHEKCPLILISDRLAEERKKVVQEIKTLLKEYVDIDVDIDYKDCNYQTITDYGLKKILDQIERGVK